MVQNATDGKQILKKISQIVKKCGIFQKIEKNSLEIEKTYAIMKRDAVRPFFGTHRCEPVNL